MSKYKRIIEDEACTKMGQTIKDLRAKKGVTQNEMAYEAKMTTSAISNIENGHVSNVYFSTIIKIANYFEVPLQAIIG